jgi:hypothetical protein
MEPAQAAVSARPASAAALTAAIHSAAPPSSPARSITHLPPATHRALLASAGRHGRLSGLIEGASTERKQSTAWWRAAGSIDRAFHQFGKVAGHQVIHVGVAPGAAPGHFQPAGSWVGLQAVIARPKRASLPRYRAGAGPQCPFFLQQDSYTCLASVIRRFVPHQVILFHGAVVLG